MSSKDTLKVFAYPKTQAQNWLPENRIFQRFTGSVAFLF